MSTEATDPNTTTMSAASAADHSIASGQLDEKQDGMIVLSKPGTNYRLHLAIVQPLNVELGRRVSGRIYANAMRIDVVQTGGRMIEPVFGRPRRLQGRVLGQDDAAGTLLVDVSLPFICKLMGPQKPSDFEIGNIISFNVERGARFEPI